MQRGAGLERGSAVQPGVHPLRLPFLCAGAAGVLLCAEPPEHHRHPAGAAQHHEDALHQGQPVCLLQKAL